MKLVLEREKENARRRADGGSRQQDEECDGKREPGGVPRRAGGTPCHCRGFHGGETSPRVLRFPGMAGVVRNFIRGAFRYGRGQTRYGSFQRAALERSVSSLTPTKRTNAARLPSSPRCGDRRHRTR